MLNLKDHINDLVGLQQKLLKQFKYVIDPTLIDSKGDLVRTRNIVESNTLEVCGEHWEMGFHGVGVCFTRKVDGVVVDFDKHVDKPNSFSPWRLSLYLESIGHDRHHNDLREILDASNITKTEHDRYELRALNDQHS